MRATFPRSSAPFVIAGQAVRRRSVGERPDGPARWRRPPEVGRPGADDTRDRRRLEDPERAGCDPRIDRGRDGDRMVRRPGARVDEVGVAGVPRRADDHDSCPGGVVGRDGVGIVAVTELRAERHVDHVEVIGIVPVLVRVDRPLERLRHEAGRSRAAENPQRVEAHLRRDAGPDTQGRERHTAVPGPRESRAVGLHSRAADGARHVTPVSVAVHGVGVGLRGGVVRTVAVAGEIVPADDARSGEIRVGSLRPVVCAIVGLRTVPAEHRVLVVDTGVDDPDLHAFARIPVRTATPVPARRGRGRSWSWPGSGGRGASPPSRPGGRGSRRPGTGRRRPRSR